MDTKFQIFFVAGDMPRGSCFLESTTLLNIALGFGIAIFACIYVAAPFSGMYIPIPF